MPCALRGDAAIMELESLIQERCCHYKFIHPAWVWKCDTVADATFQIMIMFNLSLLASTTLRGHVGVLWVASLRVLALIVTGQSMIPGTIFVLPALTVLL